MSQLLHLAAANTTSGLTQALLTLVSGALGSLLLLLLIVAGVICVATRRYGAFAIDLAAVLFISFFVFNNGGATSLMHSVAQAL